MKEKREGYVGLGSVFGVLESRMTTIENWLCIGVGKEGFCRFGVLSVCSKWKIGRFFS